MKVILIVGIALLSFGSLGSDEVATSSSAPYATKVVAKVEIPPQKTMIPVTTLYTPSTKQLLRVSYYFEWIGGVGNGIPALTISWGDDYYPQQVQTSLGQEVNEPFCGNSEGDCYYTFPVRTPAGKPIQYSVTGCSPECAQDFRAFIIVERLI